MDAQQTANPGLLLNDDEDTLVPIGTGPIPVVATQDEPAVETSVLVHPARAPREPLERAFAWIASPFPTLGLRALVFVVSGVNLGVSRRERELRQSFCALYRAAYDQTESERQP